MGERQSTPLQNREGVQISVQRSCKSPARACGKLRRGEAAVGMAGPTAVREHTQGGGVPLIALLSVARASHLSEWGRRCRARAAALCRAHRTSPRHHKDGSSEEETQPLTYRAVPCLL